MSRSALASGLLLLLAMPQAEPADAQQEAHAQQQAPALNDAHIAHIAVTANAIDIEIGEIAGKKGSAQSVQEFASLMITDHTAVNEQAAALAAELGVTPEDNPVSRSLREGADAARKELAEVSGEAFDRAYMAREVAYHRAVLQALDDTLIPGTTNERLGALLRQARGAIAAHLEHAERLHTALGQAARRSRP